MCIRWVCIRRLGVGLAHRSQPIINQRTGASVGPMRVWLQALDVPGLMVTRSLGDGLARQVRDAPTAL